MDDEVLFPIVTGTHPAMSLSLLTMQLYAIFPSWTFSSASMTGCHQGSAHTLRLFTHF